MESNGRICQRCRQSPPPEANFCPFCGVDLSKGTKDYTQYSYTELVVEAKRIEVAIKKDERLINEFRKKIQDGTLKLNSINKNTGLGKAEVIETIKRDVLKYVWAPGGAVHPLLNELVRVKEELSRRERIDDYQQIERFIRELQEKN